MDLSVPRMGTVRIQCVNAVHISSFGVGQAITKFCYIGSASRVMVT